MKWKIARAVGKLVAAAGYVSLAWVHRDWIEEWAVTAALMIVAVQFVLEAILIFKPEVDE